MKLLIVDDSAMIRRAINSVYSGSVFTDIQTAADGLLALTVFKQQLPDVVTLDITMPHMDGLATLVQMLEIKPKTMVLVISALADHHTAIESLMRGARQFICKPFTDEDLKAALETIIGAQKAKPARKLPVMESDTSLNDTISDITSTIKLPEPADPSPPSMKQYPSGYVEPPSISGTVEPVKPVTSVPQQISVKDMFAQIHAENNNDKIRPW